MVSGQAASIDNAPGKGAVAHLGGKGHAHRDAVAGRSIQLNGVAGANAAGGNDAQVGAAVAARGPALEPAALP